MRLGLALLATVILSSPATAAPGDIEKLGWLAGTWTGTSEGTYMEEIWSTPSGGGLIGMHKDTKGGRMTSYEFFRVISDSGRVCYMASPLGKAAVPFRAIELRHSRVVFENREHDFPQRILYWLDKGRLHARIEGMIQDSPYSEEWVWERAKTE